MKPDCTPAHRYAVYFAPRPGSAWWDAGSQWLGRCAATPALLEPAPIAGIAPELQQQVTAEPRRYGWHATLKAPFALGAGVSLDELRSALGRLAASLAAFDMPALRVQRLGDFLALCADGDNTAINAVASACVTELNTLSAPLTPDELQRRRHKGRLSPQEDALLVRWGYPYVHACYRFHLSLTGNLQCLDSATVERLEHAAQAWFGALPRCRFDGLALFFEPTPGADFVFAERWELGP
jgi:hypothetical protein